MEAHLHSLLMVAATLHYIARMTVSESASQRHTGAKPGGVSFCPNQPQ